MCIAVPMKLASREGELGVVEAGGVKTKISLALVPEARVGDYVIVHAGFAIQTVDEEAAAETLALLREIAAAADEAEEGR